MIQRKIKIMIALTVFFIMSGIVGISMNSAHAARLHPEKYYQEFMCPSFHGEMEHVLPDRTRVDCLTKSYAMEFDFANKWAEGIGQAIYYGTITERTGVLVLIMEEESDSRFYERAKISIEKNCLSIELWCIGGGCND